MRGQEAWTGTEFEHAYRTLDIGDCFCEALEKLNAPWASGHCILFPRSGIFAGLQVDWAWNVEWCIHCVEREGLLVVRPNVMDAAKLAGYSGRCEINWA